MKVLAIIGNVIWFIFGGGFLALFWLIIAGIFAITIIGLPIARACLEFAKLSAFPFGKAVIRETELKDVSVVFKVINIVLNVIWFPFGIIFTILYLVGGIISFITIIGIPVGIVYIRMGKFLLFPMGARVVSKEEADAFAAANSVEKRINKHVFTWVGTFLFGYFGVDRFMRGQIGLGILKIITCGGWGIWMLVDWIIALTKLKNYENDFIFVDEKWTK